MESRSPFTDRKVPLPRLFFEMMKISAFTFGGGFVIIGMMRKKFCEQLHWVTDEEVLDMTAIAQSAPGALAVNSAVIFGYRTAGIPGALVSALGTVIPPVVIISLVCMIYDLFSANPAVQTALQVMRAGVGAILADVTIDLGLGIFRSGSRLNIALMFAAFIASWFFRVSAVRIILVFIALGIALNFVGPGKGKGAAA